MDALYEPATRIDVIFRIVMIVFVIFLLWQAPNH